MGTGTWLNGTRRASGMPTSHRVRSVVAAAPCALSLALWHSGLALAACPPVPNITELGTLPSSNGAVATGINNRGQIVGWGVDQTPTMQTQVRPFVWNPTTPNANSGAMTDIAALPD